jgi:hypothetical protein
MVDAAVHCVCCGRSRQECECWEWKDGKYRARIRCAKGCFKCGLHCKHAKVDTIASTLAFLLLCLSLLYGFIA